MAKGDKHRVKFTDKWLKTLRPNAGQDRTEWRDTLITDFIVRVTAKGTKAFSVRYRSPLTGKKRRHPLGRYPIVSLADAREGAKAFLSEVARGIDPNEQPAEEQVDTFEAMARQALDALALKGRGGKPTRRKTRELRENIVDAELLPTVHRGIKRAGWANRPAGSITRREVIAVHEAIHKRGKTRWANVTLLTIHRLFDKALQRQFPGVEYNPAASIELFDEGRRAERYLNRTEIGHLLRLLEPENDTTANILRIALYTVVRWGTVKMTRWEDLDLDAGEWRLLGIDGQKIDFEWTVPLVPEVVQTLRFMQQISGDGEWVFPSRAGAKTPYIDSIKGLISRLNASTDEHGTRYFQERWTAHRLRDTFTTHAQRSRTPKRGEAGLGLSNDLVGLVMSHKPQDLTFKAYTADKPQYRIDERRDALEQWARFLADC